MRKKILWILGSFLFLLAVGVVLFHSPYVKHKILKHVEKTLAQSLNLALSAQSLDYNLFTLRVSLKKPTVGIHDNSTLPPFFQADELILKLTPALILGKKIDIRDIRVVNPRLDIRVNADGTLNIPPQLFQESGKQESEEPAAPLLIRHLGIKNGHLSYREAGGLQADIPGIRLSGTFIDQGKQEIFLQVNEDNTTPGQLIYQDKRLRLETVDIAARLDSQEAHIILKGTELHGNESISFNGQIHWKDQRLSIPGLHIVTAGGEISGNGEFYQQGGKSEPAKQNRLSLNWKSLNLQSPLITAYFPHPVYSEATGKLDLLVTDFSLNGIRGDVEISVVPLNIPAPKAEQVPLTGRITAHLEPGTITIGDFDFTTPGTPELYESPARVHGNFHLKNRQFQGELYSSFRGEQLIVGHLRLSGQLKGDFSNPRILARLESKGIRWGDQVFQPGGNLEYETGD